MRFLSWHCKNICGVNFAQIWWRRKMRKTKFYSRAVERDGLSKVDAESISKPSLALNPAELTDCSLPLFQRIVLHHVTPDGNMKNNHSISVHMHRPTLTRPFDVYITYVYHSRVCHIERWGLWYPPARSLQFIRRLLCQHKDRATGRPARRVR